MNDHGASEEFLALPSFPRANCPVTNRVLDHRMSLRDALEAATWDEPPPKWNGGKARGNPDRVKPTECPHGHSLEDAYIAPPYGVKQCRTCKRASHRRSYEKMRANSPPAFRSAVDDFLWDEPKPKPPAFPRFNKETRQIETTTRSHCRHGHELTGDNLTQSGACRACKRESYLRCKGRRNA